MTQTFKPGDNVTWDHSQGTTTGHVVKKQTRTAQIKGHKVAASPEHPEYIVESDKTGAKAAHLASELKRG
jgi:hypothetical protein